MVGGGSTKIPVSKKIALPCFSCCKYPAFSPKPISGTSANIEEDERKNEELAPKAPTDKNLCAICLDQLSIQIRTNNNGKEKAGADDNGEKSSRNNGHYNNHKDDCKSSSSDTIFRAECGHIFHLLCIASNVRHGGTTCPVCRSHWTQLPRLSSSNFDPVLRILDDSIAALRVNRSSILSSTLYNDDDPIDDQPTATDHSYYPHLHFVFLRSPKPSLQNKQCEQTYQYQLSVKLSHQKPTDIVLVASSNRTHLRLLKQSMALVVLSLHPVDRLAIVVYFATASTRVLPLRRMSSQGKQAALQVIDQLCCSTEAESTEGLRKGVKILKDRRQNNPRAAILLLSDRLPTMHDNIFSGLNFSIPVHGFKIAFEFGMSNGFLMHKFEDFLAELVAGLIRETQVKIGSGEWVKLGEMRGGEQRRIPVEGSNDCSDVCSVTVAYRYFQGGTEEDQIAIEGETVVVTEENSDNGSDGNESGRERSNCFEKWEYADPFIVRRWAKHLHGQKT